jgi:uncharacterized membrane protein
MISLPVISPLIYVSIRQGTTTVLKIGGSVVNSKDIESKSGIFAQSTMCVILAIFLLLNTGAVATAVEDDYAPSNIVSNPTLESSDNPRIEWRSSGCISCDAHSVNWMVDHRNPGITVYTDAVQKSVRYYGFTVASNSDTSYGRAFAENSSLKRENTRNLYSLRDGSTNRAYVRLHSSNIKTGMIKPGRWSRRLVSTDVIRGRLNSSNKIYSSRGANIYLINQERSSSAKESNSV